MERVDERWGDKRELERKGKGREQHSIEIKSHSAGTLLNFLLFFCSTSP